MQTKRFRELQGGLLHSSVLLKLHGTLLLSALRYLLSESAGVVGF